MSSESGKLLRGLGAWQMAMLAVGCSIGTGLLLGSGAAVQIAGPAIIFSYLIGAVISFIVTMALGEIACRHPEAGSFGVAAEIYLGPWAGFVTRYGYWFSILLSVGAEMTAAATYMKYWFPHVPGVLWIVVFVAAITVVNMLSVTRLGDFEFWFAMIKLVTIIVFIVIGAALLILHRVPSQYLVSGSIAPNGTKAIFLPVCFALFSFLGIELIAISSGEARSTDEIRRGTYYGFGLLAFVYL